MWTNSEWLINVHRWHNKDVPLLLFTVNELYCFTPSKQGCWEGTGVQTQEMQILIPWFTSVSVILKLPHRQFKNLTTCDQAIKMLMGLFWVKTWDFFFSFLCLSAVLARTFDMWHAPTCCSLLIIWWSCLRWMRTETQLLVFVVVRVRLKCHGQSAGLMTPIC